MKARILVVDDEAEIRRSVRMILEYEGYDVQEASSGPEALALVEREPPDLVFLDIKMGGHGRPRDAAEDPAGQRGAAGRHHLGPRHREHRRRGDQARRLRLHREAAGERARAGHDPQRAGPDAAAWTRTARSSAPSRRGTRWSGRAPSLRQIWDAIKRAAPTTATVLLLGESGAGKELVARAIHRNSLRSRDRFVQVNCAAIPEELIESELFGHEKGSFTGATEKQIGKFEQADRGTIFLDEVGDMSAEDAGQGAARAAGRGGRAPRLGAHDQGGRPRHRRDQQGPRGRDREGHLPRGSLLPPERHPDPRAAAARSARGHSGAGAPLRRSVQPREQPPAAAVHARGARVHAEGALEGERARAAQHRRAAADHDARRRHRRRRSPRRRPRRHPAGRGARPSPSAPAVTIAPGTLREFKESAERKFLVEKLRENAWNISKTAEVIGTPRSNLYKKLEQYAITEESDG